MYPKRQQEKDIIDSFLSMKQLLRKVSYQRFLKNCFDKCTCLVSALNVDAKPHLDINNNDTAVNNRGRKRKHR